jgi:flagellar protein FliL
MADDDDEAEDEDEEGEEDDDEEGGGSGGSKKLLLIIGVAVLLVIGGVAAAYFTGLLDPVMAMLSGGEEVSEFEEGEEGEGEGGGEFGGGSGETIFYDMPDMLVNLNTPGRKSTFLKIRISLELQNPADVQRIELMMPRIMDNFQVYLRELRIDDLKGSVGMYRLRQELLARVAAAAAPAQISDVLFKEMLVQ